MINILLGAPGGGKSYEAVVYHVLPALKAGRKVITNLPLALDVLEAVDPNYLKLVEIRKETLKSRDTETVIKEDTAINQAIMAQIQSAMGSRTRGSATSHNMYPFSHADDYGDPWRHPETGAGPLYVIDECHIALPYSGTPLDVEHWYSLHRHESADVLLITQSYSKINKAIRELLQVVYQVRKNTALGSQASYSRKVKDGLKGEVVNTSIRRYEKQYFKYYQSHTKGGGSELSASDIVPIWKHWTFKGAAVMFAFVIYMFATGRISSPLTPKTPPAYIAPTDSKENQTQNRAQLPPTLQQGTQPPNTYTKSEPDTEIHQHPFDGLGVHILASVHSKKKGFHYLLALSQNGQVVQRFSQKGLINAGYTFKSISNCSALVTYEDQYSDFIRCDLPQTSTHGAPEQA